MIYGYCRVSTNKQEDNTSLDAQEQEIKKRYPEAVIVKEVRSGAEERPLFLGLIEKLESGDTLVITKLDRFCRTAKEGLEYIDEIRQKGVAIHILNMGIMDDSPMGRTMTTIFLAFAEFERNLIIERCQGGRENKRRNDPEYKEGRPYIEVDREKLKEVRDSGLTSNEASARLGISRAKYYQELCKMQTS